MTIEPTSDPLAPNAPNVSEQVAAQCKVVSHLAQAIARVHEDYAKLSTAPAFGDIITIVGVRSAALMETLGNVLNEMDACSSQDEWTHPVFEAAQKLFPSDPLAPTPSPGSHADLEGLSARATPGPWLPSKWGYQILTGDSWSTICTFHGDGKDHRMAAWEDGRGPAEPWSNADFVAALVNEYHAGRLVARSEPGAVEAAFREGWQSCLPADVDRDDPEAKEFLAGLENEAWAASQSKSSLAALAASPTAPAGEPSTPVGYALVPEEATGEMWAAGQEADAHPGDSYSAIWRAMIGAAPTAPAQGGETQAARDVLAERRRQVEAEGWTPEHDDRHHLGEMAWAAAAYAEHASRTHPNPRPPYIWPWHRSWWKPTTPRRDLVKAAALILAEIERLDRASPSKTQEG